MSSSDEPILLSFTSNEVDSRIIVVYKDTSVKVIDPTDEFGNARTTYLYSEEMEQIIEALAYKPIPQAKETKQDALKRRTLELAKWLLEHVEEDITSGIGDGMYDEEDNEENLKLIAEAKQVFAAFEKAVPDVYVYVSGGNVQGVSATCDVNVELYDKDNYENATTSEQKEMGSPDEWDEKIKKMTKEKEIKGVY